MLGAILLTGYLGGAVATRVQAGSPLATHALFPIYVGELVWAGLFLREERLRALVPVRRTEHRGSRTEGNLVDRQELTIFDSQARMAP